MSFVDDFDLNNYQATDELRDVKSDIESEISVLRGYLRGIAEKLNALEEGGDEDETEAGQ